MYEPWNALEAPRFTCGLRTYARLPHVKELAGVDAAVYGMPWDGGTSFRSGARFGPEAIRSASGMIRTYNPVAKVQVFGSAVDDRLRRRGDRPRLHRGHAGADPRTSCGHSRKPGSRASAWAGTTR